MDFDIYGDDSKGVVKLDPRTKMLLFLASSAVSLNLFNDLAVMLYVGALCLVLGLCGKRATAAKLFALAAGLAFLRWCVQSQGTGSMVIVLIIQVIVTVLLFAFPVLVSLLMLIQTTRISQFLAAFSAMHLPARAVIPVAVMFRFIPTVQDEWSGIRKAMKFRGIELTFGSVVRHPGQAIEHLLVPLLFSSASVMEELAAAAEARGLDADHARTSYEEVHMHVADYVTIVMFVGLAVGVVVAGQMAVAV